MDPDDIALMPMGFVKKYTSMITNLERYRADSKLSENRSIEDYHD